MAAVTAGAQQLRRRVARLDHFPGGPAPDTDTASFDALATIFIQVMQELIGDGHPFALVDPAEADQIMATSRLLRRLDHLAPQLIRGPLDVDRQFWVATAKPPHLPEPDPLPRETSFRPVTAPAAGHRLAPSPKPFGVGLFTATGVGADQGMWRRYLDLNVGSSLHPRPWRTWRLTPHPHARICEVTSATAWVELLTRHPHLHEGQVFPDWARIAESYDAVHLTLHAIAAVQGLPLTTQHGPSAVAYWDVESAFWLRWSFTAVEPVEMIP